mmetsp:Transcript_40462/g.61721  ORF Transcript_40462/g.61721 Transcript_40462/m.61721 type:complete len:92 (+) Transcript_40462:1020-1295(+)
MEERDKAWEKLLANTSTEQPQAGGIMALLGSSKQTNKLQMMKLKIQFDLEWKYKQNLERIMQERVLTGQILRMRPGGDLPRSSLDRVRNTI